MRVFRGHARHGHGAFGKGCFIGSLASVNGRNFLADEHPEAEII